MRGQGVVRRFSSFKVFAIAAFIALLAGVLTGIPFTPALASGSAATGTGGLFVSQTGRFYDTTTGTGGATVAPLSGNTWHSIGVDGVAGVPASGVSAVEVEFTVINPTAAGILHADKDGATTPNTTVSYVSYQTTTIANTAVLAVGSDGKIQVNLTSTADLRVDVQGYFTSGNTAAGGYVPTTATVVADTTTGAGGVAKSKVSSQGVVTFGVGGVTPVPSTATTVMLNITESSPGSSNGYVIAYPGGASRPSNAMYWPGTQNFEWTTTVALPASGQVSVYVAGGPVNLQVAVEGYFTPSNGSSVGGQFTPANSRVYDSRSGASPTPIAGGGTRTIQVTGIHGIPLAGSGVTSVAVALTIIPASGVSGHTSIYADNGTAGPAAQDFYSGASITTFAVVPLGPDGGVNVYNGSGGNIDVVIDVEGWYTTSGAAIPSNQSSTQSSVTLQGTEASGGAWVTYNYRNGTTGSFAQVPAADATIPGTTTNPAAWPVQQNGSGTFDPYTWTMAATLAKSDAANGTTYATTGALIQVEACFGSSQTDSNPVCSMPQTVDIAPTAFGGSRDTTAVGPGNLSLLTGDFEVSSTDVNAKSALDSLTVGRTLTTLSPATSNSSSTGVFGPGWTADLSGPDAGDGTLTVSDQASKGYEIFTDTDHSTDTYQATTSPSTYPITFTGVGDNASDGVTVSKASATTITMTDPDWTVTTWTETGSVWAVTSVTEPGSNTASTYTTNSAGLVTRVLGPVPSGVTCSSPDTTPGCRSIVLNYENLTVAGTTVTRLQSVSTSLPQTSGATNTSVVSAYDYTSGGLLQDAYDPRVTPNLKTGYSYNSANRLVTLTPPGEAAWTINYDSTNRVSTVTRPDPSGATATRTIVYGVPFTGSSAPIELGASATATWAETADLPVTATAVFSPDRVPAGTTPSTVSSSDWPYASIDYLDVNGQAVNTASYGASAWQINTTQYDADGDDVWDLTAGDRAQALTPSSSTDTYVASLSTTAARANLLASSTVYNPLNLFEVTDTYGPTHPITLKSGTVIDGQDHVNTAYDEGSPSGATYNLPTTTTSDAINAPTGTETGYPDANITHTGYGAINTGDTTGWSLSAPTSSTVQMAAAASTADLTTITRYNAAGQTIESRLPAGSAGGTAQDTVTTYYTATGTGACVSASNTGLVCSVGPATQPSTGKSLPVKTYTYDPDGNVLTQVETAGTTIRTTTDTYDVGERPATSGITVTPTTAGGTPLPAVTFAYDPLTGLATTTKTGSGASQVADTTGYNNIGEATSYTDSNGNASTTSYDLDGRAVSVNDGKGTTTYTYDSSTEHRGLVTAENLNVAGMPSTFGATYDAAGNMTTETYPNGLAATSTFDNTGTPTSLAYAMGGTTWMNFTETRGLDSQIVAESSPQSSQALTYDQDGRLTTVQDTLTSGPSTSCSTRQYAFDADSNRTSLSTYAPSTTGACATGAATSTVANTFDQADRLTNTGYAYDTLGRTTTVPAVDAAGVGQYTGNTGNLTVGYYANDFVNTETQGTGSLSYNLDPEQNRVSTITNGSTVTTNHYSDDSDSPAWNSTSSSSWNRSLDGIDGSYAASEDQTGAVTLELANMHGDIVATALDSTSDTGVQTGSYSESTEYGIDRASTSGSNGYGWLGTQKRSANSLGGLVLMGIRLYDSNSGRFLSTDPVQGGNANAYVYPDNPVSASDPTGRDEVGVEGGGGGGGGASIGPGDADPEGGGGARGGGEGDSVVSLDPGRQAKAIRINLNNQTYTHVFQTKHDFGPLLRRLGSERSVLTAITRSLFRGNIKINNIGVFDITRTIDGVKVGIRGRIINGIPDISTAFVPKK